MRPHLRSSVLSALAPLTLASFLLAWLVVGATGAVASSEPAWQESVRQARMAVAQRDYPLAELHYQEALVETEEFGELDLRVALVLNELGRLQLLSRQTSQALFYLEMALEIRAVAHAPEHPDVQATRELLARVHLSRGELTDAEERYREILSDAEDAWGRDDPELATPLINLAAVHLFSSDPASAAPLLRRAVALRESDPAWDPEQLAEALHDLAFAYFGAGRLGEAEQTVRHALELNQRRSDSEGTHLAISLRILGSILLADGRLDEAGDSFDRSLAILTGELGSEHPMVADLLYQQSLLAQELGDRARSDALASRAFAIDPGVDRRGARFVKGTGSQSAKR